MKAEATATGKGSIWKAPLRGPRSQYIVRMKMGDAKRRGKRETPPPLANFGARAWPRGPLEAMRQDTDPQKLLATLV